MVTVHPSVPARSGPSAGHRAKAAKAKTAGKPYARAAKKARVIAPPIRWRERLTVTPKEVQDILGIGHSSVYRLMSAGRLEVVKPLTHRTLVTVRSVIALVEPS